MTYNPHDPRPPMIDLSDIALRAEGGLFAAFSNPNAVFGWRDLIQTKAYWDNRIADVERLMLKDPVRRKAHERTLIRLREIQGQCRG